MSESCVAATERRFSCAVSAAHFLLLGEKPFKMTGERITTHELKRELPEWAKIVRTINGIDIYNMSVLDNIISWTKNIPDVAAIDYFGTVITFGELPGVVKDYANGLKSIGIKPGDVVTLCLPVTVENNILLFALNNIGAIQNSPNFLFLRNDFKRYTQDKGSRTLVILDAYLPHVVDSLEECGIENVIIANLKDYLPEDKKHKFDDLSYLPPKLKEVFCDTEKREHCEEVIKTFRNIKFFTMREVISKGKESEEPLYSGPVDIDRDVSYSYTSGTTGAPKCILFEDYYILVWSAI